MSGTNGTKLNGKGHHIKPDQWDPTLMCEGPCRKPTKHSFKFAAPYNEPSDTGTHYYHLMYECLHCAKERVFGLQSAE